MAISAKFTADFTSFHQAVQKAEVQLRSFETGASKVEKSLSRMTDNFSGRKLIQETTLMVAAVGKLEGGLSNLTNTELRRLNARVEETTDKMRALGIAVPPSFGKVTAAAAAMEKSLEPIPQKLSLTDKAANLLTGTFGQLVGAFSIAGLVNKAASALVGFASDAVKSAGTLVDLSNKTGLSLEALQRFQHVANQTGSNLESFADAAFKLGARIGGGSGSVRDAVRDLGLEFTSLKAQRPDQQFETIAAALGKMEDPQRRNTLAIELFGKAASTVLPAIAEGYADIARGASVSSDAQVRALDRAADAWQKFVDDTKKRVQGFLGDIVISFQNVGRFIGDIPDLTKHMVKGGSFESFFANIRAQQQQTAAQQVRTTATILNYREELAKAQAAVNKLTAEERAQIAAAQKLGVSTEDLLDRFGLTEGALRVLTEQTKQFTSETKKEATELAKAQAALRGATDGYAKLTFVQKDVILHREKLGLSAAQIATQLKLEESAVKRVIDADKELIQVMKEIRKIEGEGAGLKGPIAGLQMSDELIRVNQYLGEAAVRLRVLLVEWADATGTISGGIKGPIPGLPVIKGDALLPGFKPRTLIDSLKSVKAGDFAKVFGDISGFFKQGAGKIATGFLEGIGGALTGGLSSLLSTGVSALVKGLGKLFGFGESEAEKTSKMRRDFLRDLEKAGTSLADLKSQAERAGFSLDLLLDTRKTKDFQREVEKLKAALDFSDRSLQTFRDTLQKYGIAIGDLGAAGATHLLGERVKELWQDMQVLAAGQINVADQARFMKDALNQFVRDALAAGIAIPRQFQAIVQSLIDQGLLLDANGEAFTSLEDAGITFGDTMVSIFEDMRDAIRELVQAIRLGLGLALSDTEQQARSLRDELARLEDAGWGNQSQRQRIRDELAAIEAPTTTGPTTPPSLFGNENPGLEPLFGVASGGRVTANGVQRFGIGGRVLPFRGMGTDTVPAMLTPGELVLNRNQQQAVGALLSQGRGGASTVAVSIGDVTIGSSASEFDVELEIGRRAVQAMKNKGVRFRKRAAA